jgi:hypothetical protein
MNSAELARLKKRRFPFASVSANSDEEKIIRDAARRAGICLSSWLRSVALWAARDFSDDKVHSEIQRLLAPYSLERREEIIGGFLLAIDEIGP